jgi:serine/threonine-protein kinase
LLPTAARLVGQIAKALTTAHRAGIVHRDLKPENIYLVKDNDDEYIKVFDFGTAKALSGFKDAKDITTLGSILGTPDYMAPEQLAGDVDTDHRVDVWSLAVVAFHLITGELPFAGEGMGEVIHGIIFGTHRDPTEINPDLPPDLDAFFDQALHKKREERFQSARALAAALAEIAAIRPSLSMTLDHGSVRSIVEEHDERKAVEQAALSWPGEDGQSVPDVIGPDVFGPDVTGPEPSDAGSVGNGNGSDDLLSTSHLSAQALSRRRPRTPPWDGLPKHVVTGGGVMAVLLGGVVAWLVFGSHGGSEPVAPAQATSSAGAPTPSVERPSSSAMPSASSASSATVTAGSSTTVSGSAAPAKSAPPAATARPTWRPKQDIYEDVDVDY